MDSRQKLEEQIKKALLDTHGIGPVNASKGATSVMWVLDRIVENAELEEQRDEDGILYMKRPEAVPEEYNYMYWGEHFSTGETTVWVHPERVHHFIYSTNPGQGHYTCMDTKNGIAGELCIYNYQHPEYRIISKEDIPEDTERGIEDRIRRLV